MHSRISNAVHLDTRDPGFEYETKDCFVKAIQAVTGVPYRDAHAYVAKRFNRRFGKGTHNVESHMRTIAANCELIYGFRALYRKPDATIDRWGARYVYGTVTQFARMNPRGRFLLCSSNHAFAVIDGRVHDNGGAGARTRVRMVYQFLESSKCEAQAIAQTPQISLDKIGQQRLF